MPNPYVNLDDECLKAFGVPVTFAPKDGSTPQTLTGVMKPPPMLEQAIPGSSSGVTNVYLFVKFVDITPNPATGDIVTFGGVSYDISNVQVDRKGGATLKLRRNA